MSTPAAPKRRLPRPLRFTLIGVGAIVVIPLILIPIIAWAVDLGGLVKGQIDTLKPGWEARIGRKIDIGAVSLRLFPTIAAEVKDVAVAAAPEATGEAAEKLFQVGAVRVGIAAWPLLRSLGKDIRIARIEMDAPRVNVIRFADGRLSYQDILDRLTSDETPSAPLTPEQLAYLQGLRLGRAAITSAALRFRDLATAGSAAVTIDQLDLIATDLRLGEPFTVTLDAAMLAPARNLHLAVTIGAVPIDLKIDKPLVLVRRTELKLKPVEIEPLLKFLPPSPGVELGRARLDADLLIDFGAPASDGKTPAQLRIQGEAGASQLVLQLARKGQVERGLPADVRFKTDVVVEPDAGNVLAKLLDVRVNRMGISGSADLRSLYNMPRVNALALSSHELLLEDLTALLPPSQLPAKSTLRGPLAIEAKAAGTPDRAKVELGLNLDSATVILPSLRKSPGVALNLGFRGQIEPNGVAVERLGLVLGPLSLLLHGYFHSAENLDMKLDSGKVDIDPLLRLLPTVAEAVPPGQSLAGQLSLSGTVKRRGKTADAKLDMALAGASAKAPGLELVGGAKLNALLHNDPGSAAVDADLDLTQARLLIPGTLDKGAGVPMRLKLDVRRGGDDVSVREARLALPGGTIDANGAANTAKHTMRLTVPLCELDLGLLARVAPILKQGLPPALAEGKLKFALAADGDPERLSTVHVKMNDIDLTASGTRMRGTAEVTGLDPLQKVAFNLRGDYLDVDKWTGSSASASPSKTPSAPSSKSDVPPSVPPLLKTLTADGKLRFDKGRMRGISFQDLIAELTLASGKARFDILQLSTFGGLVSASGTTVDFVPPKPRFSLRTKLEKIELPRVLAVQSTSLADRLDGKGTLDLAVDGAGLTWEQIAPALTGQLKMALTDGKLRSVSLGGTAVRELIGRVKGLAPVASPLLKEGDTSLRDLTASFAVDNGQLRITRPIQLSTNEGQMRLQGSIGLDQKLALTGNLDVAPKVIETVTGGQLKPASALPLDLRISGTLTAPVIEVTNGERLALSLASTLLQGKGKELLQGALGDKLGGQLGQGASQILGQQNLDQVKQAAAKRLQDEAQKRLEEQAKRLLPGLGSSSPPAAAPAQAGAQPSQQQPAPQPATQQQQLEDLAKKGLGEGLKGLFGPKK